MFDQSLYASGEASLEQQPDEGLLTRCRELPPDSLERATAQEVLVRRYEPLVRQCVWAYSGGPGLVQDLVQVGHVGLFKAIHDFDPGSGGELRAYAVLRISGEISRYLRDKRSQPPVVRPPAVHLPACRPSS